MKSVVVFVYDLIDFFLVVYYSLHSIIYLLGELFTYVCSMNISKFQYILFILDI